MDTMDTESEPIVQTNKPQRHWIFTLNNPDSLLDISDCPGIRYCIYQEEVGENGTLHFQGYLELARAQRLSWLRRWLPNAHFEPRRGTREQARAYCTKEETRVGGPYEHGDWMAGGQGTRNDLRGIMDAIKLQRSLREIAEENPGDFIRYSTGILRARSLFAQRRTWKSEVRVLYGPTGTGKSSMVARDWPAAYWKPRGAWWDGYDGQQEVVIDDFYGWLPYDQVLRMCDRYPLDVEVKGGFVTFVAKQVAFTSNKHPQVWWANEKVSIYFEAFARRVETWIYMPLPNVKHEFTKYEDFKDFVFHDQFDNNKVSH